MTVELTERPISRRSALIICLAFILMFSANSVVSLRFVYGRCFSRLEASKSSGYLESDGVPAYSCRIVHFESGMNTLTGYMFGEKNDKGLVVISHELGSSVEDYLAEIMYFVDKGWRVFAFDYTGTRASEGDTGAGLTQSVLDLDAALTYARSDSSLRSLPVMLFGHGLGAYANTAVLNYDHDVSAVVSISGFNSPMGMLNEEMRRMIGPLAFVVYPYGWAYQTMLFGGAAKLTAVDGINNSNAAVMIVHGTADEFVSYDGASIISQRSKITNPNVAYKTCSAENRNGHRTLLRSEAAIEYATEASKEYSKLYDRYEGCVPDYVKSVFYSCIDRTQTSELDLALFSEINTFFEARANR